MLDQENQLEIEQSTVNSQTNPINNNNHNPLDDHDYCNPNKKQMLESSKQQQQQQQARTRKPRQSTSVTDKSQWITGDDQIDSALSEHLDEQRRKRQRKEFHDPNFSRFTSSEYSSSEVGSDQDAESDQEYDSEDDPDRLWCICRKPFDGKFMISCDGCKDWFHGSCVNVTKLTCARWEKEGKEWFCGECDAQIKSGVPKSAIQPKIVKKDKKDKKKHVNTKQIGKRGRGRPKKSEALSREVATRFSLRSTRKSTSSTDSKHHEESRQKRGLNKSDARSESFNEFSNAKRLRELIQERKKAFFLKRDLIEKGLKEKAKTLGLNRRSLTSHLSDQLDSLAHSTNTPNMNNLPINIKSELRETAKTKIVLQINTKKDGSVEQGNQRIVTAVVKSEKKKNEFDYSKSEDKKKSESNSTKQSEPKKIVSDSIEQSEPTKVEPDSIMQSEPEKVEPDSAKQSGPRIESDPTKQSETEKVEPESSKPPGPKRLRISIDTKLDPANISRLREPLIKPIEPPTETDQYSPSKTTPVDHHNDVDEEPEDAYDPEFIPAVTNDSTKTQVSYSRDPCWSGTIVMPDVGKFSASAKPVSGNLDFMREGICKSLMVCGRIAPDQINSYIKKLRTTTRNRILLVQLHPQTEEDRSNFDTFFDYLYSRNRCGVINSSAHAQILKDFYIMPIHKSSDIPDMLKPIEGPGLERNNEDCLLGLLVKSNKPTATTPTTTNANSVSGYTPTSI